MPSVSHAHISITVSSFRHLYGYLSDQKNQQNPVAVKRH